MGSEADEARAQQILDKANQVELQFNDVFTGASDTPPFCCFFALALIS